MPHTIGRASDHEGDPVAEAYAHDEEMRDEYEEARRDPRTPIVCLPCAMQSLGNCEHVTVITVFEAGREYGGPEEGGWWYDTGEPVLAVPIIHLDSTDLWTDEVRAAWDWLRTAFPRTGNRGRVHGGEDYDIVAGRHVGEAFPKERPHYE